MAGITRITSLIVAIIVVVMTAEAQTIPPCVETLVGCVASLNTTTTPPATCCDPLKEAITNELPCLCTLFNTPGLLQSLGINVTQALQLPARCGISAGITECTGSPAPAPNWEAPPSGSTTPNSATSPAPTSEVSRSVSTGIFSCLLSMFAAAVLY